MLKHVVVFFPLLLSACGDPGGKNETGAANPESGFASTREILSGASGQFPKDFKGVDPTQVVSHVALDANTTNKRQYEKEAEYAERLADAGRQAFPPLQESEEYPFVIPAYSVAYDAETETAEVELGCHHPNYSSPAQEKTLVCRVYPRVFPPGRFVSQRETEREKAENQHEYKTGGFRRVVLIATLPSSSLGLIDNIVFNRLTARISWPREHLLNTLKEHGGRQPPINTMLSVRLHRGEGACFTEQQMIDLRAQFNENRGDEHTLQKFLATKHGADFAAMQFSSPSVAVHLDEDIAERATDQTGQTCLIRGDLTRIFFVVRPTGEVLDRVRQ
jgi:hypothetical protein